ncbi:MAG TPA: hypothetical protein VNK45_11515 [Candidatus Acidoferrales bacterium]|nr:hypothetical protein [Candidatus Acidoferrales bacterium]
MINLKLRRTRRFKHRLIIAACLCLTWAATQTSPAQPAPDGPRSSRDFRWGLVAYHIALPGYALTPADIDRMADAGIGWLSIDLAWYVIQPTPEAALDFSALDPIIDAAHHRGLKIVGKLGAGYNGNRPIAPPWTRDLDEDAYLAALGRYADATVRHFADRIQSFALENEFNIPNVHALIGWRVGVWTPEFMDRVMQVLAGAVHREAPGAEVMISITPLAVFEPSIERMNRLINYDSIGVHTYPVGFIPDLRLTDRIKDQIARARRAGEGRPVIILETGLHTEAPPWTERLQADYLEAVSKASREAGAKGIFFYQYLDNPEEAGREAHFGLLRPDRSPKEAWLRYRSLIQRDRP